MDGGWTQFVLLLLTVVTTLAISLLLVLPRILEKFVAEKIRYKYQTHLQETESSLQIYGDILKSAIEASGTSGHEARLRSIGSVETLWQEILRVEGEFGALVGIENITTDQEMNDLVRDKGPSQVRLVIKQFSDFNTILERAGMSKNSSMAKERIFVSEKLWKVFNALIGIHTRLAILVSYGIANKKDVDWKNDKLMIRLAEGVIPETDWKVVQGMRLSGFKTLSEMIRQEFLKEARKAMRGSEEFSAALEDFHGIMTQQEMIAQEERAARTDLGR